MNKTNIIEKDFSVIVLAAGKSERVGFPKLLLKYDEYNTFLEHITKEYNEIGAKEIIVVVNAVSKESIKKHKINFPEIVKLAINEHPDWHRFYSLKLGANQVKKNHFVFVHNVDNPFVNQKVLDALLNNSDKADYISPEYNRKGGHPFLISYKIINDLKASDSDEMHLKEFLNQYSGLKVPVNDKNILVNINTLGEYRTYFKEI
jgi:CTP:molybdopterin cytidylyltransferase MocA